MQKRLERRDKIDNPMVQRQSMKLNLKATGHFGNDIIRVNGLSKGFQDKPILKNSDLRLFHGDRVALIGPNGCGKTTFIKMLLGEERTDSGSIELGSGVKPAYLPQNVSFNNEEISILDCFREDRHMLEGKAREYLSKFMFFGSSVFKKVGQLSGGERVRLKLGMLLYDDVNLLVLDEPTNHLDIDSIETLEEALDDFKGTIFFISHDRYFINRVCSRVVAIEENKFQSYEGNYDFYKRIKAEQVELALLSQVPAKKERIKETPKVDESKKAQVERERLEKRIDKLEEQIKELDIKMALASNDYEEVNRLYTIKESLNSELENAIAVWSKI
jgi:ATPase subunit of ABC transporter with duplicated ATPase domains